ncbi:MAG: signal peptidase II [Dehalococcoidales bacterium]|nr:signal peptidase II [Dehalococcoidales bacterium]
MRKASSLWSRWWRTVLFFLVALAVAISDQLSKAWIRSNLAVGQSLPVDRFTSFTHTQNTGAAFGIFADHTFMLTIVSFIGAVVVLFYKFYLCRRFPFLNNGVSMAALGAVLGGTVGNLIDRLTLGYVTDFVAVGTFPAYNVADASLTTGVSVFAGSLIYLLVKERQEAGEKEPAPHGD